MGKGTRRMLLACLIPAVRPRVPASRLAVGNGTCFPSRSALAGQHCNRRRAELCSHLRPRSMHAPDAGCRFSPPKGSEGSIGENGETAPFPHPTAHPAQTSHPSAGLGLAGNKSCSSPLPNSGRLGEVPKPSVMPELLIQGRSPPPTLEHPGCHLQPLHIPPMASGSYPQPPSPGWDGFPGISLLSTDCTPSCFLHKAQFNSI